MSRYISPRANFSGSIEGIEVSDLGGLDFNKFNSDERLAFLEEKLKKVDAFFLRYFLQEDGEREYFKCNINTTDELSQDINICKIIERYGTYLLNSSDVKNNMVEKYEILTEQEFKRVLNRESATDFKAPNCILDTRPSNDYTHLDLKITKSDMFPTTKDAKYGVRKKDLELAEVLKAYERLRVHLKNEMEKIKNKEESTLSLYKIKYLLSTILGDMYDSKRMILGVRCPAKRLGDESPYNDFSAIDYSDKEHIRHCLKFCKITNSPRPDDMCSHIGYDLKKAIERLQAQNKIDFIDLEIIDCYNSNYTIRDIATEVGKDTKTIQQRLDKICRRIKGVI